MPYHTSNEITRSQQSASSSTPDASFSMPDASSVSSVGPNVSIFNPSARVPYIGNLVNTIINNTAAVGVGPVINPGIVPTSGPTIITPTTPTTVIQPPITTPPITNVPGQATVFTSTGFTLSFSEKVKGWVSFKSFIPEMGVSCANEYFTFKNADIYHHHHEGNRNVFYNEYTNSNIKFVFNQETSIVKEFRTINYEGSQSKIDKFQDIRNKRIDNLQNKDGWYVENIQTDLQSGQIPYFLDKENKWFNYIRGEATTIENLDSSEFSFQGVGIAQNVDVQLVTQPPPPPTPQPNLNIIVPGINVSIADNAPFTYVGPLNDEVHDIEFQFSIDLDIGGDPSYIFELEFSDDNFVDSSSISTVNIPSFFTDTDLASGTLGYFFSDTFEFGPIAQIDHPFAFFFRLKITDANGEFNYGPVTDGLIDYNTPAGPLDAGDIALSNNSNSTINAHVIDVNIDPTQFGLPPYTYSNIFYKNTNSFTFIDSFIPADNAIMSTQQISYNWGINETVADIEFTYSVTDANGDTDTQTNTINITRISAPSLSVGTLTINPSSTGVHQQNGDLVFAIQPTIPVASGGTPPYSYDFTEEISGSSIVNITASSAINSNSGMTNGTTSSLSLNSTQAFITLPFSATSYTENINFYVVVNDAATAQVLTNQVSHTFSYTPPPVTNSANISPPSTASYNNQAGAWNNASFNSTPVNIAFPSFNGPNRGYTFNWNPQLTTQPPTLLSAGTVFNYNFELEVVDQNNSTVLNIPNTSTPATASVIAPPQPGTFTISGNPARSANIKNPIRFNYKHYSATQAFPVSTGAAKYRIKITMTYVDSGNVTSTVVSYTPPQDFFSI